jgi:methionyl-tRNA formyltransferase
MRVLFWGTPDFATPPLRALIGEGYDVVGVVTQPDRPQGRHHSTLVAPAVKAVALEEGIPVLQPERPRGDDFVAALRDLAPDLSVVVAYGQLLPAAIIDLPGAGTLNIHASLLPRWRGAAPIQAALWAGDAETGVSIMRMVLPLDAGPVLLQVPTPILDDETYGELRLRLSELGALALVEALTLLELGAGEERPQDEAAVTFAPKVGRAQALLSWGEPCERVARTVRAYDPQPGAWSPLRGTPVKFFGARAVPDARGEPGTALAVDEQGLLVACGTGAVRLAYVQPAGKRRLTALDWHQGRGVGPGDSFAS